MDKYMLQRKMEQNPDAKLKDLVRGMLYDEILNLEIMPGTKLNINQIASQLGISRTPVVEAVGELTDLGFVVTRPDQPGSFVLGLDLHDMIDLYQVRDAIESEAAFLCAYNADDATVLRLDSLAQAFGTCVRDHDIPGMKETDMPFHRLIIDSCGNRYLIRSYEQILPNLTRYQSSMLQFIARVSNDNNPWLTNVKYNHTSIASAIRMRLPELARQTMSDHVSGSLNFTSLSGGNHDPFSSLR